MSEARTPGLVRTALSLYFFSIGLGFIHLLKAVAGGRLSLREAVKRILIPMDISRYFELSAVVREFRDGETVLDLSSPKLAAFYAARRHRGSVYVALDKFQKEIFGWEPFRESCPAPNLSLQAADMVQLPFKDASFDRVFSISVIEHLPGDLDEEALKEIDRVLKPGGHFQMTTPLAETTHDVYLQEDIYSEDKKPGRWFFFKFYDPSLYERKFKLAHAWKPEREQVCEERALPLLALFEKGAPLSYLAGPVLGICALLNLKISGYDPASPPKRRADLYASFQKRP